MTNKINSKINSVEFNLIQDLSKQESEQISGGWGKKYCYPKKKYYYPKKKYYSHKGKCSY